MPHLQQVEPTLSSGAAPVLPASDLPPLQMALSAEGEGWVAGCWTLNSGLDKTLHWQEGEKDKAGSVSAISFCFPYRQTEGRIFLESMCVCVGACGCVCGLS